MAFSSVARVVSNSLMSAPALKARWPAPRMTSTPMLGSASAARTASPMPAHVALESALCWLGRLIVTVAIPSRRSRRTTPPPNVVSASVIVILNLKKGPHPPAPSPARREKGERAREMLLLMERMIAAW